MAALDTLDLRDNPFSVGFHAPGGARDERRVVVAAERGGRRRRREMREEDADMDDADADADESEPDGEEFVLPAASKERDREYVARLDEDTRLRRRVYEMLLANSCRGLRALDGLVFERRDVLVKDEVWERLVCLGVVRKSRGEVRA